MSHNIFSDEIIPLDLKPPIIADTPVTYPKMHTDVKPDEVAQDPDDSDEKKEIEVVLKLNETISSALSELIPSSFSWKEKGAITSVKNYG